MVAQAAARPDSSQTGRLEVSIRSVEAPVPAGRAVAPISIAAARLAGDNAAVVATVASLADGLKVVRVDARKARATAAVGKTRPVRSG